MATLGERIIAHVLAEAGRPLTPEQQAALDEGPLPRRPPPPPELRLVVDHGPTWRPPGWCSPDLEAYERAWEAQQADRAADRAHRKAIDPYNLGHWGSNDDDA
jgi:hypothetical protein